MKRERKRLYEGMYILNANLSEDARKKALDKIIKTIEEKHGKIEKILEMGKRKLAYEIDNKREGFYYLVYFTVASSFISEIWQEFHLHEDLIRFMTMRTNEMRENLEYQPLFEQS